MHKHDKGRSYSDAEDVHQRRFCKVLTGGLIISVNTKCLHKIKNVFANEMFWILELLGEYGIFCFSFYFLRVRDRVGAL